MGYWSDLEAVITAGGLTQAGSDSHSLESPGSTNLFRAVRSAIGVQPQDMDCADVAFWEWQDMRSLMVRVWGALDATATRRSGRPEQALVWFHQLEQTGLDLEEFLTEAKSVAPNLRSLSVHRRPDAFLMVNLGKADSAIANTVAVVVKESGLPYGEVMAKLLDRGGSDEELLAFLDSEVERLGAEQNAGDQSAIPRLMIRAKQKVRDQIGLASLPVAKFLEILDSSNNITNVSDEALFTRLLNIAPEENKAIAKKVEATRIVTR